MTEDDWDSIKYNVRYNFKRDNFFSELKENEMMQGRLNMLGMIEPYLGRFYSKEYVQKNILLMTDAEISDMNRQISREEGSSEDNDNNPEEAS